MSQDSTYFAARSVESRRLAMASADEKVREIHLEMAEKYAALAQAEPTLPASNSNDGEQKTA